MNQETFIEASVDYEGTLEAWSRGLTGCGSVRNVLQ